MKKMKKLILSLAIIFSGSINILAQDKPVAVENGAKIEFNKEVHDYGTIKNGADGTCIFEIKNTGSEALIISNAKGSCGCTVPSWPKEPIAPGATSQLKVKYDTKRTGSINKSVTIFSNAINEPTKVVRIKGSVSAPLKSGEPVNNAGPANN